MSVIHLGTSGWSYKDWLGVFYPDLTKQADYLPFYAKKFDSVEVDSTFYAIPRKTTVQNWYDKTPDTFTFSLKVPQIITHEKRLNNCESEWNQFVQTAQLLKHKLGPIVLQFDYKFQFNEHFFLLNEFLKIYNFKDIKLCVEIRNKDWHNLDFYDLLRKHNVALVLNDLYYMPRIIELTSDFVYVRLLGNRKQIPDDFSHVRVKRDMDLDWWADWIHKFIEKELDVWVYSNNRYQGHAPATIAELQKRVAK
ncbi:MAG: DUF72 domain-containing protein [Calditrichaceae bacterium]|nr:DUF72 domain-containing protein [Calditrichaceae bacterium]